MVARSGGGEDGSCNGGVWGVYVGRRLEQFQE